jgi:hypothetical protein
LTHISLSCCKEEERQHPDYERAREAEINELRKGNYRIGGIGFRKRINKNEIRKWEGERVRNGV